MAIRFFEDIVCKPSLQEKLEWSTPSVLFSKMTTMISPLLWRLPGSSNSWENINSYTNAFPTLDRITIFTSNQWRTFSLQYKGLYQDKYKSFHVGLLVYLKLPWETVFFFQISPIFPSIKFWKTLKCIFYFAFSL